jgi:hypothetical protein
MPWQAQVLNVAMELDPVTHLPAYREVRLKIPRQSGKTTLEMVVEVDRSLYWGPLQRSVYAAQDRNNSRKKWEEQADYLLKTPLRQILDVRRQTGLERMIFTPSGSEVGITASEETSGHGFYIDLGIIDEAWAQRDSRLEGAYRPAMLTRSSAQLWVCSTEGTDQSLFFNDKCDDGRARVDAGQQHGVAYFEWSAGEGDDPDDPDTWIRCMPALGHTISVDTIAADKEGMDPADFARYYLNRRVPKGETVIDMGTWRALLEAGSQMRGVPRFAIDTTPERSWTSIAAAGWTPDHRVHLEVLEHRPGTDWAAQRMYELTRRWGAEPVLLDPASPAGSLEVDMTALGVRCDLVTAREYAAACGQLYDAITATTPTVVHLDQPVLDSAMQAARKRPLGDAWAWARKLGGDVSPLVAVTLARYSLVKAGEGDFRIG